MIDRDAGGRIGKIVEGSKKIKTPNIAVVVNPNKMTVPIKKIKKIGFDLIITNSYIIWKSRKREEIEDKGLHKFFGWKNFIYTDSGTFQMFSQGVKDIDNEMIVEFQKTIGSDFITPVDVFTLPDDDLKTAEKKLEKTFERVKETESMVENFVYPIQGGLHLSLRKKAVLFGNKLEASVFAIGGIVPLMNNYEYKELADVVLTVKKYARPDVPIHAFGAGHPITFAFLTALGVDLFDSAMYSIAAERDHYLTPYGTKKLEDIEEFSCSCEVCRKYTPEDLKKMEKGEREKLLAIHNLYVIKEEISRIRQAIREERLWELVQIRARSHPKILEALVYSLKKYKRFFKEVDAFPKKKGIFYGGEETKYRPEILKAKEKIKKIGGKKLNIGWIEIPKELYPAYPFYQSEFFGEKKDVKIVWERFFKKLLDYQFGKGAGKYFGDFVLEYSKSTGKPRKVFSKDGVFLGSISGETMFFLPSVEGAERLKKFMKKIILKEEAVEFVKKGKSVFAKFCETEDKITPGEEVLVVDKSGNTIAVGKAVMNYKEIKWFKRGVAVKTRDVKK